MVMYLDACVDLGRRSRPGLGSASLDLDTWNPEVRRGGLDVVDGVSGESLVDLQCASGLGGLEAEEVYRSAEIPDILGVDRRRKVDT